jgi:hypothetical protein
MSGRRTGQFPAPGTGLPYLIFRTTPRDRWLAGMLHEHRALTSTQIHRLAFSSLRSANRRLAALTGLGVCDRIRPNPAVYGPAPYVYTLGPAGALLLAAQRDQSVKELRYDRAVLLRQAARPDLAHTLGCNTLMITLATAHRTDPALRLAAWWGPVTCLRIWGDVIRPDAYALWRERTEPRATGLAAMEDSHPKLDSGMCGFFVEYDTGTESSMQVAGKIEGYLRYAEAYGGHRPVLIQVPDARREQRVHAALAAAYGPICPVPIATSAQAEAAGPLWHPLGAPAHVRYRIGQLPTLFRQAGYRLLAALREDPYAQAPDPAPHPDALRCRPRTFRA